MKLSHLHHVGNEPADRLTELCARMIEAFEADPLYLEGDRAVVMLDDGVGKAGLVVSGYDDQSDAMADLLVHMEVLFEANGIRIELVMIPDDVGDLDQ